MNKIEKVTNARARSLAIIAPYPIEIAIPIRCKPRMNELNLTWMPNNRKTPKMNSRQAFRMTKTAGDTPKSVTRKLGIRFTKSLVRKNWLKLNQRKTNAIAIRVIAGANSFIRV